jgi:hypothetical protein
MPGDAEAALAMTRDVELYLKPRQIAQARDPRNSGAGICVGDEVKVLARLGHVVDRDRNLPRNASRNSSSDLSWDLPSDLTGRRCALVVFRHS